ncbi:MAG: fluoride efflux transporter FluC [Bacillota bacterium]
MRELSVGLGGILGALVRYFFYSNFNSASLFPLGTLTVNLTGSFFLAFFLTVALRHLQHRSVLVLAVSTGFTGSFTTFSSLSVEAVNLLHLNPVAFAFYIIASFFPGLLLAFAGRRLGDSFSLWLDSKLSQSEVKNVE